MRAAVPQLTGRCQNTNVVNGITADTLNHHYARISSDSDYQPPQYTHTAAGNGIDLEPVSEWQVFKLLDTLSRTAGGLNKLPAWFLRVGAPLFYKPVTRLFIKSIVTSTVPCQWKVLAFYPFQRLQGLSITWSIARHHASHQFLDCWSESTSTQ